ncbi:hypothetical protein MF672_038640 [Actinomadura sp. ATCC 31491]|uniref:DUF2637 domain-containing protein n=1 Tax=Actinomadura luzonensis TaxID=2805427 RepID=A0ABT0G4Z3_9ACTN|nr:hypothetical protein [Actinomadura luzonensis]MCK2219672.1 hypothetical protein [Actinomadura luzonensis]
MTTPKIAPEPSDEDLTAGMTPAEVLSGPGLTALRRRWRSANGRDPETGHPIASDAPLDQSAGPDPQDLDNTRKEPKARRINAWRERRRAGRAAARAARRAPRLRTTDRSGWAVLGVIALALLVLAIVGVGLYTGLGALRDTALAAHIEPSAARLWWIGIDGLIVVAIVAAMILRHDPAARRYALGIVALFTAASGLLQFLHGLGWTAQAGRSGGLGSLPWQVVAVIAVLVIGTIFCGTHLFVYTLRHLFPSAMGDQPQHPAAGAAPTRPEEAEPGSVDSGSGDGPDESDRSEEPALDPEADREVRKWFAAIAVHMILDAGGKPVRSKIARSFGIADRQAGYVIADVIADREEAAERQAQEDAARAAGLSAPDRVAAVNGSGVGA